MVRTFWDSGAWLGAKQSSAVAKTAGAARPITPKTTHTAKQQKAEHAKYEYDLDAYEKHTLLCEVNSAIRVFGNS